MTCNMGKTDRMIRLWLGIIILAIHYVIYFSTGMYFVWANLAWLLIITGLFKWCPFYVPLKISTADKNKDS